jgi:hypothetical protein
MHTLSHIHTVSSFVRAPKKEVRMSWNRESSTASSSSMSSCSMVEKRNPLREACPIASAFCWTPWIQKSFGLQTDLHFFFCLTQSGHLFVLKAREGYHTRKDRRKSSVSEIMFPFPTGFHGYGQMGGHHAFGMTTFEERYHAVPVAAADKTDTSVSAKHDGAHRDSELRLLCLMIAVFFNWNQKPGMRLCVRVSRYSYCMQIRANTDDLMEDRFHRLFTISELEKSYENSHWGSTHGSCLLLRNGCMFS